jgi:hypothetical protein
MQLLQDICALIALTLFVAVFLLVADAISTEILIARLSR